jgi:hypothetical protein
MRANAQRTQGSEDNDIASYQGVAVLPGDVINFLGGAFTTLHYLDYGHTGLYLGVDPENHQRTFLDFTWAKGDITEKILGSPQPFFGRLLGEREFLNANANFHDGFDVFRLRNSPALSQAEMFKEAKRISETKLYGLSGEVCSSAVISVLSKGSGLAIKGFTPNSFEDGQFQRLPQLAGKSINILAALREVEKAKVDRDVVAHCRSTVDEKEAAGELAIKGCRSCSPPEKQQNLEKLRGIRSREILRCEILGLEEEIAYEGQRKAADGESVLEAKRKEIEDRRRELGAVKP